jgi:hypothetical protein
MPSGIARRNHSLQMRISVALIPAIARVATFASPNGALRTTYKSAGDVLRCAFDNEELGQHPKAVYLNGTEPLEPSKEARDERKTKMLWTDSVRYAGVQEGQTVLKNWQ